MGQTFYDLTIEELCDLMCGKPEEEEDSAEAEPPEREYVYAPKQKTSL